MNLLEQFNFPEQAPPSAPFPFGAHEMSKAAALPFQLTVKLAVTLRSEKQPLEFIGVGGWIVADKTLS